MKVFDFTNFKKGDLLDNIRRPQALGGSLITCKDGSRRRLEVVNHRKDAEWAFHMTAHFGDNTPLHPSDFGPDVRAVCFCIDEYQNAYTGNRWGWVVLSDDPDWQREAYKAGALTLSEPVS